MKKKTPEPTPRRRRGYRRPAQKPPGPPSPIDMAWAVLTDKPSEAAASFTGMIRDRESALRAMRLGTRMLGVDPKWDHKIEEFVDEAWKMANHRK